MSAGVKLASVSASKPQGHKPSAIASSIICHLKPLKTTTTKRMSSHAWFSFQVQTQCQEMSTLLSHAHTTDVTEYSYCGSIASCIKQERIQAKPCRFQPFTTPNFPSRQASEAVSTQIMSTNLSSGSPSARPPPNVPARRHRSSRKKIVPTLN